MISHVVVLQHGSNIRAMQENQQQEQSAKHGKPGHRHHGDSGTMIFCIAEISRLHPESQDDQYDGDIEIEIPVDPELVHRIFEFAGEIPGEEDEVKDTTQNIAEAVDGRFTGKFAD